MATFLTTSKMDPALAARIEASVTGRRGRQSSAVRARRIVSLVRFVLVLTVGLGVYNVVTGRRETKRALERSRTSLLESVSAHSASLGPEDRSAVTRAESWLLRLGAAYDGDLVAEELRAPGAFAAMLARPMLYVRGAQDALTSPPAIAAAAAASTKDALLLCLLDPPASRTESVLLEKARSAYAGGTSRGSNLESRTANVRRLNDVIVGLPFLLPPWSEKVRAAENAQDVARLRTELERAPIERAKQAAAAGLLLVAIDEAGDGAGPTELDGERKHPVRVALVDLASSKVLLRARHVVDPSPFSATRRATYAVGLDGCSLALDVHDDVRKAAP
ncbi:MAG: hypothetical protein K0S65_4417 [Labilithrix sp.]|nr:hypothetical protein [Labilithrix sp.]